MVSDILSVCIVRFIPYDDTGCQTYPKIDKSGVGRASSVERLCENGQYRAYC